MAVLMRVELQGVTLEQLRPFMTQVKERIKSYPGFIAQASGSTPGGVQVTEVWETQEAHERWVQEVVGPMAMQQLGMTQVPPSHYLPLDDFITR
jgi:hypothetical protein